MKAAGILWFIICIVVAGTLPIYPQAQLGTVRLVAWAVIASGVLATALQIRSGNPFNTSAVLADRRNRYSLPNLITLVWFVVIVSAYLATALWNIGVSGKEVWQAIATNAQIDGKSPVLPIAIEIPAAIWVLAGIVGVGLVGAGAIVSAKDNQPLGPQHIAAATAMSLAGGGPVPALPPRSPVFMRPLASEARLADLVTYDEIGVQDKPDLAALQHLMFQIAAVLVYAVALGREMYTMPNGIVTAFPTIPEGFLALLGVSGLTALGNRAVPR